MSNVRKNKAGSLRALRLNNQDGNYLYDHSANSESQKPIPFPSRNQARVLPKREVLREKHEGKEKVVQPPLWSAKKEPAPEEKKPAKAAPDAPKATDYQPIFKMPRKLSIVKETDLLKFLQKLKVKTKECLQRNNFKTFVEYFDEAIERVPDNPDFFCNRSYGYFKLEYYQKSIEDAATAIQLKNNYGRGYYRRACAYVGSGKLFNALLDFEYLTKILPNSKKINCLYSHCSSAVNKSLFNRHLCEKLSTHIFEEMIIFENIRVEDSYKGLRTPQPRINPGFIWDLMRYFRKGRLLHRKVVYRILMDIRRELRTMPSLIQIQMAAEDDKITICGDINGQFLDLIRIFEMNGFPSAKNRYVFNGNLIGRGYGNLEVCILLFALKTLFPARVFIARGHQESIEQIKINGFENEVKEKYSEAMYLLFLDIFKWFPLAHCLNQKVLIVHGGLFSDDGVSMETLKYLERNADLGKETTLIKDILYSDPKATLGREPNYRGMGGILFGQDVTYNFLIKNDLEYIVRSHEYKENGYQEEHEGTCITVFSTPNYNGYNNKAAVLRLAGSGLIKRVTQFDCTVHPTKEALYYADSIYQLVL